MILPAYLDGLAAEDYEVDAALVRRGYLGGLAARSALCTLPAELLGTGPDDESEQKFTRGLRLARTLLALTEEVTAAAPSH